MSVYRKGRIWHYDFVYQGVRFYGSTGQDTKRAAEAVERKKRLEAATGTRADAGELTLDLAASRYWDEVSPQIKDADHLERRIHVMLACYGKNKRLKDIDAPDVLEAIARRRVMGRWPPKAGTINRDLIDTTMRPLLNRARKVWKARGLAEIDWAGLRQREPEAEAREYTPAQIEAWLEALPPLERFAVHLLLRYGFRFGELFFDLDAFDGSRLALPGSSRKNARPHIVPLLEEDARTLAALVGIARAAKQPHVWLRNGEALSYGKLHGKINRAAKRAGLTMGRVIHGARHHAGTRILRETGNLRIAQRLLGHATIQSTVRYAHASEGDLRAALDALSRHSPEAGEGNAGNALKE
ncbi:MAG TPA: integrase [Alphaproteobacteria bacterium]|nr:integrase [Alphaproteobacteria bacterium]